MSENKCGKFGNSAGNSAGKAISEMNIKYYMVNKNDLKGAIGVPAGEVFDLQP